MIFLASFLVLFALGAAAAELPALEVVPEVDLQRYAGTWYEIARLPNWFQKKCAGEVAATYTLLEDGDIRVVNRCRTENGDLSEAVGRAKLASPRGPNTKLKVRFAPGFLAPLLFVWGDYWIIALAPDYSYAAIGEPNRKYLWILARAPQLDEAALQAVLEQVRAQGYDLSGLLRTQQTER
ncbi:MAG: lipocalin family protein [bacterium]|nr:lipocalin family protein [bacterium]